MSYNRKEIEKRKRGEGEAGSKSRSKEPFLDLSQQARVAEGWALHSACLPYKGPAFGLMCYVSPPFRVVGVVRRKLGACLSKVYG